MPRGRPRLPGTEAERAEARRAKVRQNVQAFRARQKKKVSDPEPEGSISDGLITSETPSKDRQRTQGMRWMIPPQTDYDQDLDSSSATSALIEYVREHTRSDPSSASSYLKVDIPNSPDIAPAYRKAFIAAFYDRYHPDTSKSPQPRNATWLQSVSNIPCSSWVESACHSSSEEDAAALSEATLAAALAVIGAEKSQQDISIEGIRIYLLALKKIRNDLFKILKNSDPEKADLRPLFLASFACANVEFLCNHNLVNMLEHIKGMGSLIQRRGVEAMRPDHMRIMLYEFRVIDSTFCIVARKSSFLCRPEWIDTPWRKDPEHQAIPMQSLLDVGYTIPPLLEAYDLIQPHGTPTDRLKFLPRIQDVHRELDEWVMFELAELDSNPDLKGTAKAVPVDAPAWARAFAYPFKLLTWSMAAALINWLPFKMMILDMILTVEEEQVNLHGANTEGMEERLQIIAQAQEEILLCARAVRECTPHFLQKDKKIIGWIMSLFPFQLAGSEFMRARRRYEVEKVDPEEMSRIEDDIIWYNKVSERFIDRGFKVQFLQLHADLLF